MQRCTGLAAPTDAGIAATVERASTEAATRARDLRKPTGLLRCCIVVLPDRSQSYSRKTPARGAGVSESTCSLFRLGLDADGEVAVVGVVQLLHTDRKSTRLNSSHSSISYA